MPKQKFLKEFSEKYPKCFSSFWNWCMDYLIDYYGKDKHLSITFNRKKYCFNFFICNDWFEISFEMLTGILEKFFEDKYKLKIFYAPFSEKDVKIRIYDIDSKQKYKNLLFGYATTKKQAHISAYLKSAEIVEGKIK